MAPDIRDYLRATSALVSDISGDRTLVRDNRSGTFQLYEVVAGRPLRQLTDFAEPVEGRYLPNSDRLIISMSAGGNELDQLYFLEPVSGVRTDLVVDPAYRHILGDLSDDGRLLAYATNRRNNVDFDIVVRDLTTATERVVHAAGGECQPGGFSPDGRHLTFLRPGDAPLDVRLLMVDLVDGAVTEIAADAAPAIRDVPRWLADSSAFYVATNAGRDLIGVARVEMATRAWRYVMTPPADTEVRISRDHSTLFVTTNEDGVDHCQAFEATTLALRGELPTPNDGVIPALISVDGDRVVYSFESSTGPSDVLSVELSSGTASTLVAGTITVPAVAMVAPTHHRITSFDGERFSALLYRPATPPDQPPPVVVVVHGGPEGQSKCTFNPVIQYLVAHGYAVVAPNVRGSLGYGKRFYSLDDRRLRLDSVSDLGALHDWLGGAGLDPTRAALYGGSYGGYMVLAGVTMQPERWAAAVDVVGIANLVTFLQNTSPYRRRRREHEYGYLDSDHDFLVAASPMTHIDRARAPLMIIHGRNDPRVPVTEAEQIHAALTHRGVPSELMIFEDEGHGLAKLGNRLVAYARVVEFLDRIIGDRTIGREPAPADDGVRGPAAERRNGEGDRL